MDKKSDMIASGSVFTDFTLVSYDEGHACNAVRK